MSAKGVLTFEEIGAYLHRIVATLHRPPWTDPETGGLRVGTVALANVLVTVESLTADCPVRLDPVIEVGQVDPPVDPLQGLATVYDAKTSDRVSYAFNVGMRIS